MRSWMIGIVLGLLPVSLLPALPSKAVSVACLLLSLLLLSRPDKLSRLVSGCILGVALAMVHGQDLLSRKLPENCVRQPLLVSGTIASLPQNAMMPGGVNRQRFEFDVHTIEPASCDGPVKLLLSYYGAEEIVPGQDWSFKVLLRRPWGVANPGSYNIQAWYAQSGIDAVGSVSRRGARLLGNSGSWRTRHHRVRWQVSQAISALPMDPAVVATLRAVTVADKSGIDSQLWQLFQVYGVNHLLVISGLHVGLVAGAGHLIGAVLARLSLVPLCTPALLSLALATAYAALAGFSLATQRALVMLACFLLAGLLGRSSSSVNSLLLAALAVLLINPLAPLGSGFWLSFGAVALLLWHARWSDGQNRVRRLLGTHVFMSLAMLPLGAWWFGGSSLVAAMANLLMIPLVGLVVVPLALLATLMLMLSIPGEELLWRLAGWPLQQLFPRAELLAAQGETWLYRHIAATAWELPVALLGVGLLILPLGWRLRALAASLLLPLWLGSPALDDIDSNAARVTVLDVGQGTAVVIQAGSRALLYDTGGGDPLGSNAAQSVILPFFRHAGISELDTLVVSHQDLDHSAGTRTLARALPIHRFLYGGKEALLDRGKPCIAGQSWRWPGGQLFQMLAPDPAETIVGNDGSCVLLVTIAGRRLLLPGDIEAGRERELVARLGPNLRSDWLLAGHHGSLTSSSHAWLKTVRPDTAAVSSAYASRFGHPHPDIVERLESRGIRVLGTGVGGALQFDFYPGKPMTISQYRHRNPRFWM